MADDKPEQKDKKLVRAELVIRLTQEDRDWSNSLFLLAQNFFDKYPELINLLSSEDKQNKFSDFIKEQIKQIIDSLPILLAQEFNEDELNFLLLLVGNIYFQKFIHLTKSGGKINVAINKAAEKFQEDLFIFLNQLTSPPQNSDSN